jgi:alpha-galactosidase
MAMLTWLHSEGSSIQNVGLCHSVQGTTKKLADAVGAPYEDVSYLVAGINHQAWVLKLRKDGEDLYPQVFEAVDTHPSFAEDRVRGEMLKQFGYFVTESTRHNAEYLPYFLRTNELRDHYGLGEREPVSMEMPERRRRAWMKDTGIDDDDADAEVPSLRQSHEYASAIMEARLTGVPVRFNGNVMNNGMITNLPHRCCVEVPCVADREGVSGCYVGPLPPQCAALNRSNVAVQELAVTAVLERNKEAAFHACALDPMTAAIVPLPDLRRMFDELWEAEGDLLSYFNE